MNLRQKTISAPIEPMHDRDLPYLRPNSAWYSYQARTRYQTYPSAEQVAEGEHLAVRDIDFVEHETNMSQNSRILEIGCAWGRHSLELARRGYKQITSLDICPDLVTYARASANKAGYILDFQATDYLDYHTDSPFAVILSLYDRSCLGQTNEIQDRLSLEHLARMLQPGGYLVFGICDWPRDLPLPSRSWEETQEGFELQEVLVDRSTMTCTHRILLVRSDGSRETYELTRIHYNLPEVRAQLAAAHFQIVNTYHAFDHSKPYRSESEGLVVVAQRK